MTTKTNGGTAFPSIKIVGGDNYNPPRQYHMPGMTLRDYFAAKAMAGQIAFAAGKYERGYDGWRDEFAREAYRYADAMLKARGG